MIQCQKHTISGKTTLNHSFTDVLNIQAPWWKHYDEIFRYSQDYNPDYSIIRYSNNYRMPGQYPPSGQKEDNTGYKVQLDIDNSQTIGSGAAETTATENTEIL